MAYFEISKEITFQEAKSMTSKKKKQIATGSVAAIIPFHKKLIFFDLFKQNNNIIL